VQVLEKPELDFPENHRLVFVSFYTQEQENAIEFVGVKEVEITDPVGSLIPFVQETRQIQGELLIFFETGSDAKNPSLLRPEDAFESRIPRASPRATANGCFQNAFTPGYAALSLVFQTTPGRPLVPNRGDATPESFQYRPVELENTYLNYRNLIPSRRSSRTAYLLHSLGASVYQYGTPRSYSQSDLRDLIHSSLHPGDPDAPFVLLYSAEPTERLVEIPAGSPLESEVWFRMVRSFSDVERQNSGVRPVDVWIFSNTFPTGRIFQHWIRVREPLSRLIADLIYDGLIPEEQAPRVHLLTRHTDAEQWKRQPCDLDQPIVGEPKHLGFSVDISESAPQPGNLSPRIPVLVHRWNGKYEPRDPVGAPFYFLVHEVEKWTDVTARLREDIGKDSRQVEYTVRGRTDAIPPATLAGSLVTAASIIDVTWVARTRRSEGPLMRGLPGRCRGVSHRPPRKE
jgi:hypothetical protein